MKKIFVLASAFCLLSAATNAAEKDLDAKASNTTNNTATAVSMADVMKENQLLKFALLQSAEEKETLQEQAGFAKVMHAATTSLYELQMQQKQETTTINADYAWMMHNVILNLNALNADK